MSENLLGGETSPYLLQHKDNPVHWMPWGVEAFAHARAQRKPVLLSVGYAACHWCHVMAHESFEDPGIAALMNDLFVSIKVDREERPDVDQIYQQALALLGQQGGWPLTMFLTPDGEPFWGGTYFPPETRWGRPGFPDVLRGVASTYATEPDKVARNVGTLKEALDRLSRNRPGEKVDPVMLDQIAARLVHEVDPIDGGIGTAPKFPQTTIFELLWRAWKRTDKTPYRTAVVNTLTRMCQGGIYDHLGGGFARYSVDERWLVPHFEKMLYDNAQLIDLLTLVWQETRDPLFEARVRETVAWLLTEMVAEGGGFAATLDADSEGHEGKFYVWSRAEIEEILGPDADAFTQAYGVTADGNWEGANIPNRLDRPEPGDAAAEERLARSRRALLAARARRVRPGWDDKVLADWNGLAIAALARAGLVFDEPTWVDAAERAFRFVRDTMVAGVTKGGRVGRLYHSWRSDQGRHPGMLDDYANMARAALALFEARGDRQFMEDAKDWVAICDRHFLDPEGGGYFLSADDAEDLIVRPQHAHDNAVPAGNGTLLGVLARLWHLTGEVRYRETADRLVKAFSGELTRNFFPLSTFLNSTELLESAALLVLAGSADAPETKALRAAALETSLPNLILCPLMPGAALPPSHPAAGKGMVDGRPAAYVCRLQTCSLPVTGSEGLRALLSGNAVGMSPTGR